MTRAACAAAAFALIAAALLFMRPPGEPGVFMRDFEAYWSAGAAANAGSDPYAPSLLQYERRVPGVSATRNELLPFVGAPPALPLWRAFAALPYDAAARTWSAVLALAFAAIVFAAMRMCAAAGVLDAIVAALCALAFVPVTSDFDLGQPAIVAYAAAALCVLAAAARRPVMATLAAIAGAVQPNVALGALAAAGERNGRIALAAAVVALYAAGCVAMGFAWPLHYLALLQAHGAAEAFDAIQYAPAAIAFGFGMPPVAAKSLAVLISIAALATAVVIALRASSGVARFAIICAALPLIATFTHEHDLVLLFVPALFALRTAEGRPQAAALLAFSFASLNWLDFSQQPAAAAQDLTLAAGALFAGLAWCERRTPALYTAAAASFVLACAGAWIGHAHPAPIWPNDMHAFSLSPAANAAQTWHAEQIATGLERTEPAWALLRCMPLAGSVMLIAVLAQSRYRRP